MLRLIVSLVLFLMVPLLKKVTPIIKKELLYLFPYGPCTWVCGAFFVDRSSPKKAYETLNHCAKEMNKKKVRVFVFKNPRRLFDSFSSRSRSTSSPRELVAVNVDSSPSKGVPLRPPSWVRCL